MPRRPPSAFDCPVEIWPAGLPVYRVHPVAHPSNEPFASDRPARFRPLLDPAGQVVPMLYAAATPQAAIAESVLHDVPSRGRLSVAFETLVPLTLSCLVPQRDLPLAMLHSTGLATLRLRAASLTETLPSHYPQTLPWGQAFYDHPDRVSGIVWMSRRHNVDRVCVLFGSSLGGGERVRADDLQRDPERSHVTLAFGEGYDLVAEVCTASDVLISRS